MAGYELNNWPILKEDLLNLALTKDAIGERTSSYGMSYSVTGQLIDPNGRSVWVKTIWMRDVDEEITKFITLYPPK